MIEQWQIRLYPELRQIDREARPLALQRAKEASFDTVELIGLAVALLLTISLTRYSAAGFGMAERFGATLANFIVAIPLLLVFGGPFYVRRVRRGLRTFIRQRSGSPPNGQS